MENKYFIVSIITIFIMFLYVKVFKFKQYERLLGPKSHKVKNGTITSGGIVFMIIPLFFINYDKKIIGILIPTIFYLIIGFIDDLLILIKKDNKGINANIKLILEVIVSAISFIIILNIKNTTVIDLYFFKIEAKYFFGIFILFMLIASSNSYNLTDGVDGLLSGIVILILVALLIVAKEKNENNITLLIRLYLITIFIFFCFNMPKALIFMGDSGSLSVGALCFMISLYLDCVYLFIILSTVMIIETLSVIIQVIYFKITGKRFFKMAPIHHHLELCGISELKIDIIFYIVELIIILWYFYYR